MMNKLLSALSLAWVLFFTVSSHAEIIEKCEQILQRESLNERDSTYSECMDFYFFNSQYDLPSGSFQKVIKLGDLSLTRNPRQAQLYSLLTWLYYSRWVNWNLDHESHPGGENYFDKAVDLLEKGLKYYAHNSDYLQEAGNNLWPMAQYYRPELYPVVKKYFELSDANSIVLKQKIRVRLNRGHISRQLGEREEAKSWYNKVLELDAQNSVALRYLKALEP